MSESEGAPDIRRKARRRAERGSYPITNFHPGYGDESAALDRIEPIEPVRMQRILPRYDMSTARTRTSGLGPPLLETPVSVDLTGEGESPVRIPKDRDHVHRVSSAAGEAKSGRREDGQAGDDSDETAFTDDSMGTTIDLKA